ncbi:MAG: polysaccharide biosynthesis/export family protein [Candidatus Riflebacteria bacterium]|nr:polysaccharide biosynthesis/export family protein [Candidatus Riflebacteria bacterium]
MSKIKWFMLIVVGMLCSTAFVNAAPTTIGLGDTISVWVKGEPELSVERQVGNDGSVLLPLIGSVGVNSLKTVDAARLISGMLEDGFLREPLVQVTIKNKAPASRPVAVSARPINRPAAASQPEAPRQQLVEIVDAATRTGVSGVAMMLGNRVYQSNRLGQVIIEESDGGAVLMADGFQTISGDLRQLLRPGKPPRIYLQRTSFAESITFNVIDATSRRPVSNVEVTLDNMKIKANRQGVFKISQITKEFGEITLTRRGYHTVRRVVDYKGSDTRTIEMVKQGR